MEFSCPTDEGIRTGAGNKHSLRAFSHILFALKIDLDQFFGSHMNHLLCHVTLNALSEALRASPSDSSLVLKRGLGIHKVDIKPFGSYSSCRLCGWRHVCYRLKGIPRNVRRD